MKTIKSNPGTLRYGLALLALLRMPGLLIFVNCLLLTTY